VRDLMDEAHVEGRPGAGPDGDVGWGEPADGAGLASVDQLLADLWA